MHADFFNHSFQLGAKKVDGRFVIPSGIRCTHASTIARCFRDVPALGVITTKSISYAPRAGYREPIYARYAPGCYINAVGLANPGAKAFLSELQGVEIPPNKFLLVSIFGGNVADFVAAAEVLSPVADGFELNLSCPHAKGYGLQIGEDIGLVSEITAAVARIKPVPVFVKFGAMMHGLTETVLAAVRAGAKGVTVTNTVGPATVAVGEDPILSNKVGGLSGDGIRPLGIRSVQRVREAVGPDVVIIGMGGIGTAEHVAQFRKAGADLFGVGSALTGMDGAAMCRYFNDLQQESARGISIGATPLPTPAVDMSYSTAKLASRVEIGQGLFKIVLDKLPGEFVPGELAGKYFFIGVQGVGEKPFAILSAAEKSIIVRTVGIFTSFLETAPIGTGILLRGPYGAPLPRFEGRTLVMAGGGTGTASLLEIARKYQGANDIHFVLGARNSTGFFDLDQFRATGAVQLATDDGSEGYHGLVPDLVRRAIETGLGKSSDKLEFINCGPEPMVHACMAIERELVAAEHIWGSIEYITSCGVGICGKCASPSGSLTCIDGPFLTCDEFSAKRNCTCH